MSTNVSWILLGLLSALLLAAGAFDLKSRTIPNSLNLVIALLAIPFWWAIGLDLWPEMALQLGVAALVFGAFTAIWAFGGMGGGDVKLIGAVALWLPWQAVLALLVIMSLAGGVITLAMTAHRKLRGGQGQIEIPYGVAIAFGALWLIGHRAFAELSPIAQRFLYQFG